MVQIIKLFFCTAKGKKIVERERGKKDNKSDLKRKEGNNGTIKNLVMLWGWYLKRILR